MALQLIFLLCLLSLVSAVERNLVTNLPGFDGTLPFQLETGYVSVDEENGVELFYYFIQSEGDPVLLWLTGGDRCSVLSGLAFEIGPVKFVIEPYNGSLPRLQYNPYSWTKVAGIIFVDSPVGALNLQGYLVGNPSTGERIDNESRVPFSHGLGIISDQLYETITEHCQGEDYSKPKNVICAQALNRFSKLLDECLEAHILYKPCVYVSPRPKDGSARRKRLKEETEALSRIPPRPPMDCITYKKYLSYFWANSNITRDVLRIKKGSKDEWVMRCHDGGLPYSKDIKSSIKYHRNVTLKGYRALVYSGDHDAVVPFIGTQAWVRSLNFPIADDWRAWHLDGQSAGFTVAYSNNLTFATIKGGGHTAPEYESERCLALFSRWISNEPL